MCGLWVVHGNICRIWRGILPYLVKASIQNVFLFKPAIWFGLFHHYENPGNSSRCHLQKVNIWRYLYYNHHCATRHDTGWHAAEQSHFGLQQTYMLCIERRSQSQKRYFSLNHMSGEFESHPWHLDTDLSREDFEVSDRLRKSFIMSVGDWSTHRTHNGKKLALFFKGQQQSSFQGKNQTKLLWSCTSGTTSPYTQWQCNHETGWN